MRRPNPAVIAAIALGILAIFVIATLLSQRDGTDQDKLGANELAAAEEERPASKCGANATYDLIKRELFRQAADTRGSDIAAFDRIAASAAVRMERPVLTGRDQDTGSVQCTGSLSIDLPPGLAVVGGRRSLSARIKYAVQPAADNSGDVVLIEGADSIIVPLATLASVRREVPPTAPADPLGNRAIDTAPLAPPPAGPPAPTAQPAPPPPAGQTAQPSFNCRFARTRGEIAVCRDAGLASLDRQMAAQYRRAAAAAGPRQQAVLRATRDAFLRYRDRCASAACVAGAYQDRMREIDDIMTGRWRPGR